MKIDELRNSNWIEKNSNKHINTDDKSGITFKDTLVNFINDVNSSQKTSSEYQKKMLKGEAVDVHQVMIKSEEANVGFNMLMELRNKSMDGFQEIMRTRL